MIRLIALLIAWLISIFNVLSQEQWSLRQCVDYALEYNLELQQQIREIRIKEYDHKMSQNERLPTVQGYNNLYSNFGHSQDVFGTIQRNDNLNSNMGITAEIVLYNFRSQKNQARRAAVEVDMQQLERAVLERELTTKVVQSYLEILMQEALVAARDSAVVFSEKLYERAKATTEIGTTAQSVVYEARANLAREKQQLETVRIDLERARLVLAQLLQIEDHRQIVIAPMPTDTTLGLWKIPRLDALIANAYGVQPTMKRYALWQQDLSLQAQLTRAQYYPTITGSTSIGSTYFNAFRMRHTAPFFCKPRTTLRSRLPLW